MPRNAPPENVVAVSRSARAGYGVCSKPAAAPELPGGEARTVAQLAVRDLFRIWQLDQDRFGTAEWNPLGDLITAGSRVTLKPNWVVHENQGGHGLDCLLTHPSVIEAVLGYVALARPGAVVLGDAPIQRCDFAKLRSDCGLDEMVDRFRKRGMDLTLCDFRRTSLSGVGQEPVRQENLRPIDRFTLFDLKDESLLEPLSGGGRFRVTVYNPDLLERTHAKGRHQYLVAREVIDADVVINLPKLKCHKKACITGALKNLIGINGNKEYLPHHRKGGDASGGDCYPGRWRLKEGAEDLLDRANRSRHNRVQRALTTGAEILARSAGWLGAEENLEGAWHGNDTIWRTCLDLQRILAFGKNDGTLAATQQRRVISITDAIVAGEGEGPLAPLPVRAGFLTAGLNAAAAEWVHARLMGFNPRKIPLVREAFAKFSYPLACFEPEEIVVRLAAGDRTVEGINPAAGRPFLPPRGWRNHCELDDQYACANNEPCLVE
jgi:uncharacterized protein (DUF362 family)